MNGINSLGAAFGKFRDRIKLWMAPLPALGQGGLHGLDVGSDQQAVAQTYQGTAHQPRFLEHQVQHLCFREVPVGQAHLLQAGAPAGKKLGKANAFRQSPDFRLGKSVLKKVPLLQFNAVL